MRNFTRLQDQYQVDKATVSINCFCHLEAEYSSLSEFHAEGGDIKSENPLMICCPRCNRVYASQVSYEPTSNPKDALIQFTLNSEKDDEERPCLPVGECPECASDVYQKHYAQSPAHPKIGWEHYECPNCHAGISPDTFDVSLPTETGDLE